MSSGPKYAASLRHLHDLLLVETGELETGDGMDRDLVIYWTVTR
jgi:hypothetical protein